MENRRYAAEPNGRFWCFHSWEPYGKVPENWDTAYLAKVPAKCIKCRKIKNVSSLKFKE